MLQTTPFIYPPEAQGLDFSSLLSYTMLTIPSLTQLSAKAGATHGETPHRNLHTGNLHIPWQLPACRGDIIFPAVKDFNPTIDAVFKDFGMWEIVA